jgi:hypothetical protein
MEYLVVPFIATSNQGSALEVAALQLSTLINTKVGEGWTYVRLESVTTAVAGNAGCFGYGATPGSTIASQVVVFQR